jgi:outer membrane immunogenic protein
MNTLMKCAAGSAIAAGAVIWGAGLALADGYAAPKAAAVTATDWSGVYFGVQSGYQWSTIDQRFVTLDSVSNDFTSATVGGHLGVQHQFGSIVLGLEGSMDFNFFEKDARSKSRLGINCGTPSVVYGLDVDCTGRTNNVLSVGARAGLAMGKFLPYITGGYASGQIETTRQTGIQNSPAIVGPHVTIDQDGDRHNGWYLGGGVEWVVSPGWTMGLEYRHYEFDSDNHVAFCTGDAAPALPCGTLQGVAVPVNSSRVDASIDSVTARVSWKWGREPTAAPLK